MVDNKQLPPYIVPIIQNEQPPKRKRLGILREAVIIIVLAILIGGSYTLFHHSSDNASAKVAVSGCIIKQLMVGNSGNCVSDIQNMVDFMETNTNYNQCPFTGKASLSVNGMYDSDTQTQVEVVQNWENCYNKQEGSGIRVNANGNVGNGTWSEVCTYAYQYPKQSNSSTSAYFKASIAAGKDAGC